MAVRLPNFMDCFSDLIAQPTVSSVDARLDQSNKSVIDILAGWLDDMGFSVELMNVNENPVKQNLIARIGQGEGGLVLSGHTDTVPFNESAWESDPFRLTEKDGRLYGLGTSDMKCFFPIIMEMLKQADLSRIEHPLYILATCDEECTMAGARALVDQQRNLGRFAWIGEPTGLKPVNMHKGILMETVRLIGRSGHASDPSLGVNALEGMNGVINSLTHWREKIQAQYVDPSFKLSVPTLNFGRIQGGDNPNRICADCELAVDMRLLPSMSLEQTRVEFRQTVMQAVGGSDLAVEFGSIIPGVPCLHTHGDAQIVRFAEQHTGEPAQTVAFVTEGPYFNQLGMDTIVLGPGDIAQAHQANEYLTMERIDPMLELLSSAYEHFCLRES